MDLTCWMSCSPSVYNRMNCEGESFNYSDCAFFQFSEHSNFLDIRCKDSTEDVLASHPKKIGSLYDQETKRLGKKKKVGIEKLWKKIWEKILHLLFEGKCKLSRFKLCKSKGIWFPFLKLYIYCYYVKCPR